LTSPSSPRSAPARRGRFFAAAHRLAALVAGVLLAGCAAAPPDRFRVQATVNGQPATFILDSGSSRPALFRPAVERLGLNIAAEQPAAGLLPGQAPVGVTGYGVLSYWDHTVSTRLLVLPMPAYAGLSGDGLLGWPQLREKILQFDALTGEYKILSQPPTDLATWTRFAVRRNCVVLVLETSNADGRPVSIFVDTGSNQGVALSRARWKAWRAAHPRQPATISAYYTPGAGLVEAVQSWADQITVGPLTLTQVPVQQAAAVPKLIFPDSEPDATLGMDALMRADFVVDGPNETAYLRPRATSPPDFAHNRLGAVFLPATSISDDPLVAHVIAGSPAYRAGIRTGDVLVRIGPYGIAHWRTVPGGWNVFGFWNSPPGVRFDLVLSRWGKIYNTTVEMWDIIGPDVDVPDSAPAGDDDEN
jgi:predicted aspartyl protease